jgi:tRNA threonylcarbamoyladenosine biosynthesis protein TsaB
MITLGMDCATDTVGLALLAGDELQAEIHLGPGRHHAEVLLPALEGLLKLTGTSLGQVDLLACTFGPGSFTGVRMGVTTAKTFALALGKPIVGVSTLEALAMNAMPCSGLVSPILDARRGQVYAGLYRTGPDGFPERLVPDCLTDVVRWVRDLPEGEAVFVGSGAVQYSDRLPVRPAGRSPSPGTDRHRIRASAVALLGNRDHARGKAGDALHFLPQYLRLSEAESRIDQPV